MLTTRLTKRFNLRFPILNAPMALIAGGRLAGSVTDAGGLGLIGGGYAGTLGAEPPLLNEHKLAQGTHVGIGFITWALAQAPELLDHALALKPACLFLSFTDPNRFASKILAAKIPLICQAQSMLHVRQALGAGAEIIVAQGTEAGGHGGARATLPFVPEVADYLAQHSSQTLLLAAGGIGDGRGIAAALMLGADGVVVGTRLWSAIEALTPEKAVASAITASGDDTVRTKAIDALRDVPWPREFSFRVLKNQLTEQLAAHEHDAEAARGSLREQYQAARAAGDFNMVPLVVGEAVGQIGARQSAREILETMMQTAEKILKRGGTLDFT